MRSFFLLRLLVQLKLISCVNKLIHAIFSLFFRSGVGKSSLIQQYIHDINPLEIAPTIGASFSTFKLKLAEGKVKMQIWDTAGQEKVHTIFVRVFCRSRLFMFCSFSWALSSITHDCDTHDESEYDFDEIRAFLTLKN